MEGLSREMGSDKKLSFQAFVSLLFINQIKKLIFHNYEDKTSVDGSTYLLFFLPSNLSDTNINITLPLAPRRMCQLTPCNTFPMSVAANNIGHGKRGR